jgi:macrolide transport system ATP-binding/permease protein
MFWKRKRNPEDFAEEIRAHIELEADEQKAEGRPDAHFAARRAFGNVTALRERSYERGRTAWLDELSQDVRYALRTMRRSPAYTAGAALLLALGIGANTAIYSFVEAVALRDLPVSDPDSLVLLKWSAGKAKFNRRHSGEAHTDPQRGHVSGNFPYRAWEALSTNRVLSDIFAFKEGDDVTVVAQGRGDLANGLFVSGQFFSGLRLAPAMGRGIDSQDERPDSQAAIVISHSYWQTRFGGNPGVLGQSIAVNNTPFTIVGVAPKGFVGLDTGSNVHLYMPLRFCQSVRTSFAGFKDSIYAADRWYWLQIMGRLQPGVSRQQAETVLAATFAGWVSGTAETDAERAGLPSLYLASGSNGLDFLRFYHSAPIFLVAAMAGLILTIACANLANLQMARAVGRRREVLLRYSLGAGRWRVGRQLLTESVMLAAAGGVLSILFAWGGMKGLGALALNWQKGVTFRAEMNWNCLAVSAALTLLTGLLFGMAPALQASRLQLASGLREGRIGHPASWGRRGLVTVQIALSLLLVAGASLFVRTLTNLRSIGLGFNPDRVLALEADAHQAGYRGDALGRFYSEVETRLRSTPGVQASTSANYALVSNNESRSTVSIPSNPAAGDVGPVVMWVGPDFFAALQIPLRSGRDITLRDTATAPMVAVVNEAFANKHLPGLNPIGQQIHFGGPENSLATIVGVSKDTPLSSLKKDPEPTVFGVYTQHIQRIRRMTFFVRGGGAAEARRVVEAIDSRIPVVNVRTLETQIADTIGRERLFASLCSVFAGLALVIASVGLYGTLAYSVSRRTSEIGVRIALGASRRRVIAMVVGESLVMIVAGVAIGLPFVWSSEKVIGSFLFRAASNDPSALAVPIAVLLAAALIAAGFPAWRAARIDPMTALRHE